ncbi:hypothetical protein J1N35_026630 [Gossypium stocksii]|uniref:Aminotransferase-like plant mobile domain-containing protein n=1 Tax=Gossypium stocksii TaxID=47602 RepID=A0A9D3V8N2_9ROSI|nr:hypothetical protein J1N35_026630 [Gossypium stocksii]
MDIIYAARVLILQLIGGILLPDVNQNKVPIMYLPLLEDLEVAGTFSWGSAVLACLYRELCRATNPSTKTMGGYCLLLQSWALYRMLFLASMSHQPYVWPLVNRWATVPGIGRSFTVPMYRMMIETHFGDGFIWMSYVEDDIAALIPAWVFEQQQLFVSNVPLINFYMVEWYDGEGGFSSTREYATWYMAHGKPSIYQGRYMLIQRDEQPKSSRWQQRNARPRRNQVPPFGNIDSDTASNPDLEPQYEASSSSLHHPKPEPEQEIPPSFEDTFGDDIDPQHSTQSGSSSYHPAFYPEQCTPTTEDIFPSAPPTTTLEGTPEARPSNYQTPQQGERIRRRRRPDRYTPAPGTSPRSQ